jgi:hypothetical protein
MLPCHAPVRPPRIRLPAFRAVNPPYRVGAVNPACVSAQLASPQTGRGKKGSQRKSPSAYPALHHGSTAAAGGSAGSAAGAAASAASASSSSPAVLLGGKPLVPSMLNGIVAAFNPRISITPAVGAAGGKPSMAKVRQACCAAGGRDVKRGAGGAGGLGLGSKGLAAGRVVLRGGAAVGELT